MIGAFEVAFLAFVLKEQEKRAPACVCLRLPILAESATGYADWCCGRGLQNSDSINNS